MDTSTRAFLLAAVKAAVVGVATYVSLFVFRLGWFIPVVCTRRGGRGVGDHGQ